MSAPRRKSPQPPASKARRTAAVPRPRLAAPKTASFPIVGIGASAGGLEAFTQLLGALPVDTGLAFVLVPHLAPQHESMLTTLLSHATALSVREARDGLRAIKAEGGLTFSQDEKSAKYDGMPHSAIAAGVVDFVLPPEGLARELARLGRHPCIAQPTAARAEDLLPESGDELAKVFILLRAATGVVVNEDFDIPQFRGHTGPYLEPAAGAGRKKLALNGRRIAEDGVKTKAILLAMEEAKAP